jgi:hypothetical protein
MRAEMTTDFQRQLAKRKLHQAHEATTTQRVNRPPAAVGRGPLAQLPAAIMVAGRFVREDAEFIEPPRTAAVG